MNGPARRWRWKNIPESRIITLTGVVRTTANAGKPDPLPRAS